MTNRYPIFVALILILQFFFILRNRPLDGSSVSVIAIYLVQEIETIRLSQLFPLFKKIPTKIDKFT